MDLKYEPPSLVLAPQAHELNGRSGTMEEVVAEPASLFEIPRVSLMAILRS
jgi:hypothetical protein